MDPEQLAAWEREYQAVLDTLADPAVVSDQARLRDASRRHKDLEALLTVARRLSRAAEDLETARQMLTGASGDDRDVVNAEIARAELEAAELEEELSLLLLPKDPNVGRNVIVEIRGAEGGEEANLFARDLFEMYRRYAEQHGWRLEVLSLDSSEHDGLNEVTFLVKGADAWSRLKHEGGTHRVQRVPVTESQGRIHTSTATVLVLPEADEVEVSIDPVRPPRRCVPLDGSRRPVGQHDRLGRAHHPPPDRHRRLHAGRKEPDPEPRPGPPGAARPALENGAGPVAAEQSEQRRNQVGGGGRSEKIRTYNFKENRVTDHRVKLTLHKLDRVLEGDLDEFVDALLADERGRGIASA